MRERSSQPEQPDNTPAPRDRPEGEPPAHLSDDAVRRIARLSRLAVPDEELADQRQRLSAVLGYVDRLRSLDLQGVEPMPRASDEPARLRDDAPGDHLPPDTLRAIAPSPDAIAEFHDADGGEQRFIRVPKVLGEGGA